jgi:hypothetical protein
MEDGNLKLEGKAESRTQKAEIIILLFPNVEIQMRRRTPNEGCRNQAERTPIKLSPLSCFEERHP